MDSQSWRPGLLGTCVENAVLDGEIACVDDSGRPNFRSLLYRQRQCIFIAFDLLYLNGKDLRVLPLLERKAILKKLLRRKRSRILYLDHVESDGWRENRVHFSYASGFSGLIVSLKGGCERALSRSLLHKN